MYFSSKRARFSNIKGKFLVFFQLMFFTSAIHDSVVVNISRHNGPKEKFIQCTDSTVTTFRDDNFSFYNTCFTAAMAVLGLHDEVVIWSPYSGRKVDFLWLNSFWGLARLAPLPSSGCGN